MATTSTYSENTDVEQPTIQLFAELGWETVNAMHENPAHSWPMGGLAISLTQRWDCVLIPSFEPDTGNLTPGIHEATWEEFVERFGYNARRRTLLDGLRSALVALSKAGCRTAYINGSFVNQTVSPGDFDVCWDIDGVDFRRLDPVLMTFDQKRAEQRRRFGGELFPMDLPADASGATFLEFFQQDRKTNEPKGIIAISPGDVPR